MKTPTDRVLERLRQFVDYVRNADEHTYWDRLVEFRLFCEIRPALACSLAQLPEVPYDWQKNWHEVRWPWGEEQNCAFRWDAIKQLTETRDKRVFSDRLNRIDTNFEGASKKITQEFVEYVRDYLVHQLESSSVMLYLLLRYKCWAEWFEVKRLRQVYSDEGETGLDRDLRRFLFESGIDYPFSQPDVPGGRVDIVAGLETGDALVSEVKVWDSAKNYRVNRVCDGLRQVMHYATKYGKDRGYVVVFNLDPEPLVFEGETDTDRWPARTEHGGRTYYFIAIDIIPEYVKPVSQRDKGKLVKTHEVQLAELWARLEESLA